MEKDIIKEIFSSLTGNEEDDIDYLETQKEVYKSHPRYHNILDKILIKEKEYLNKDNRDAYDTMIKSYKDSVDYGIGLAKQYFEEGDKGSCKKVLIALIKSFSNSYLNDEFGNCVYFSNEFERELYPFINEDDRCVFDCVVDKGYVYYMYGRILLEENKFSDAILSFDLARTYDPFLKEAYFFKALLLKVNKKFNEAKEELMKAHEYIYRNMDLADFYYFVGNYCYKFINKEYEYLMYQKSYSLYPNKELYDELVSIKPLDKDLDFDENYFNEVATKDSIPLGYNKKIIAGKNVLFNRNKEFAKEYSED